MSDKPYKLSKESFEEGKVEESLRRYPCESRSHRYFSFYTEYKPEYFLGDTPYLFFNNVDGWEDSLDKNKFIEEGKKYFVRCLSYQPSESVAMWRCYGYPSNLRIRIKATALRKALCLGKENEEASLDCALVLKGLENEVKIKIPAKYLHVYDVLYYARDAEQPDRDYHSKTYYVEKGSFNAHGITREELSGIDRRLLKRVAFASEKETRFYFVLDEKLFQEIVPSEVRCSWPKPNYQDVMSIKIFLPNDVVGPKNLEIVRPPLWMEPKNGSKSELRKFEEVRLLLDIPNWGIKVEKSELDQEDEF